MFRIKASDKQGYGKVRREAALAQGMQGGAKVGRGGGQARRTRHSDLGCRVEVLKNPCYYCSCEILRVLTASPSLYCTLPMTPSHPSPRLHLTPSLPAPSTALPSSATPSTRTPGEGKSACGRGVGIKGGEKESVLVCCRGAEGVGAQGGHRRGPPRSPAAGHG